jgi:hypothetical protein
MESAPYPQSDDTGTAFQMDEAGILSITNDKFMELRASSQPTFLPKFEFGNERSIVNQKDIV